MKISAIDVGSNSVRLATVADGKTLYKKHITTRLAENLALTGKLSPEAIERTALAVKTLSEEARADNAQHVFVFATAAVRSSSNKQDFISRVKELCGLEVDVIDGNKEAGLGILGALRGRDGGIIDVGGASTEVTLQRGGVRTYTHSANIGTVRLNDLAGRNFEKLRSVALEKIAEYGSFDASSYDMYAIGGTATTLAAVKLRLKVYDPSLTDGTVITAEEVLEMSKFLIIAPIPEVMKVPGMEPRRADIIGGGCLITYLIMQHFGIERVTVSESDNLEGYIMLREAGL